MVKQLRSLENHIKIAIIVAALGYFVDVYDLILFSIVRVSSLKSLGLNSEEITNSGIFLLNAQMLGMLFGGILWGIWGDKRGRIQVLFGSICLYSFANILNAFVYSVPQYAALRFFAGLGLAGEIGAGITLVSELLPKHIRGYGTTIVATVGVSGAIAACLVGDLFSWRVSYMIGGMMGLMLLVLRISVHESGLFSEITKRHDVAKGSLVLLFSSADRVKRYLSCILVGLPIWYVVGIIATFSPELGAALGIKQPIIVGQAVLYYSIGITLGDLASGLLSQVIKSRKKALLIFLTATIVATQVILRLKNGEAWQFYAMLVPVGFFIGYWAVFVTTASEQFGTNLRATVTTTIPNFVRGATVPMTLFFNYLKAPVGAAVSAQVLGGVVCSLALLGLYLVRETFHSDLNFIESDHLDEKSEVIIEKIRAVG